MATFYTNFSNYADTTALLAAWTPRFVTTGVTYSLQTDGAATGGKVLRAVRASTSGRSVLSWNAIDADANRDSVEILFRMRSNEVPTSGAAVGGGAVRASGSAGSETMYVGQLFLDTPGGTPTPQHRITRYLSGAVTLPASADVSWSADTWYWFRLRAEGTAIKLKRWAGAVGDEPGSWSLEATDSGISAAGWVGAWIFRFLTLEWDVFAVGTNGDTAPSAAPSTGSNRRRRIIIGASS
jgi:hypothetical protein